MRDCHGTVTFVGTPRADEISAKPAKNEQKWRIMAKKNGHERDLNELNKLATIFCCKSNGAVKKERLRKLEAKNQNDDESGFIPVDLTENQEWLNEPARDISSAVELLDWLRTSEKRDGERSFEVLHECTCWIVFVSTSDDRNCPRKARKKTFLFRKKKSFKDDHDVKLCKAEFKWGNDHHENNHKAYRLQDCQGTVSVIGTPQPYQISKDHAQNEKLWKTMEKKIVQERDLKKLNKFGTFFGCSKKMRAMGVKKMKFMEKREIREMKMMNKKNNQNEDKSEIIPEQLTKSQGPLNEDCSQTNDDAVNLPECSKTQKVATMQASTVESSENFQCPAENDQTTKPILSATELLDWLQASDYGQATENHGEKSFEVLHECSCWIVFVANESYKLVQRQKTFLFRKMKSQSFTDDHDERLCNAELKFGEGVTKAYRLQNCQGTMSGVGVPKLDEIEKNWKKMVKNDNIQGEFKELNKLGTLYGYHPTPKKQKKQEKKEKKLKANQKRSEILSHTEPQIKTISPTKCLINY